VGLQSTSLALYGGFHDLQVETNVQQASGQISLRWKPPDAQEQVIPRSSLYALDIASNGLLGKYYRGNSWAGQPAIEQKDLFVFPNDLLPAPFSIEWEGQIYAPQEGQYAFGTSSDDGSLLYIDNKLVVDNGGHHADRYLEGRIQLTQGLHTIRLRYFQDDGGRVMDLFWTPPGGRKEAVPTAVLFPPNVTVSGPIALATPEPELVMPPAPPSAAVAPVAKPQVPTAGGARAGDLAFLRVIGRQGTGQGEFRNPRGVAVDRDGNIWVADTGNKRVQKLDAQGKFLLEIKAAKDAFVEPVGIAVAPDGDIYVLEPERDGAYRFSVRGEYRGKIGEGLGLYRPRGLNIDSAGVLYFANTGGNNIVKASSSGAPMGNISVQGKKNGQVEQPTDVALDVAGSLFVADTYNQRVQRLTSGGGFVSQWPIPAAGTALGPHIAISTDGIVYVTDPDNHFFSAYSPDGALLATWGGQGGAEGQFVQPVGLAVDGSGVVYIADSGNNRIQVWGKR
jgi:DNA-binding beta-propeller fold protein YncE